MSPPTVREVIRMLERDGFTMAHGKGGRLVFRKGDRTVTVHGKPGKQLAGGTWAAIKRQAGW